MGCSCSACGVLYCTGLYYTVLYCTVEVNVGKHLIPSANSFAILPIIFVPSIDPISDTDPISKDPLLLLLYKADTTTTLMKNVAR